MSEAEKKRRELREAKEKIDQLETSGLLEKQELNMKIMELENASKEMLRKDRLKATEQMIERQKEQRGRDKELKELRATVEFLEKDRS